jgi:hypothetical protein
MRTNKGKTPEMLLPGLGIFLVLTLALSACRTPARRVSPSASVSPTRAVTLTGISTLTHSPTPAAPTPTLLQMMAVQTTVHTLEGGQGGVTRTPTTWSLGAAWSSGAVTPSRTPERSKVTSPTCTPTPTPTITRWVVTDIPILWETPTPLPTPPSGAADYQLKAWDEDAALGLVEMAEQFSYADNIGMMMGGRRFNYQDDQAPIRLAAQEALHRFPQAGSKEKLEWRIALADTIRDNPASDTWILQQMEDGLNSGRILPDSLDQLLNPYGFQIGQQQPAPNLFGDERTAQVLWITRLDWGYTGLYAALSQDNQGRYALTKIHGTWNFNFGSDGWYLDNGVKQFVIEDHTGNGIPEVIMSPYHNNGTFCSYELIIYQWEQDQFVEASQNQIHFSRCDEEDEVVDWKYGAPDENGAEPIETWQWVSEFFMVYRYRRFEWNGAVYELSENRLEPPEELNSNTAQWVIKAIYEGDYATVIEKVGQYLTDASQWEQAAADFGPSYPDYLRFQLGLAYAFQSDGAQARAVFEQIVQTPNNPLTTTVPQAAQAYLDNYSGDADLYRACQAALKVMEKTSGAHPFGKDTVDYARLRQAWGYAPYLEWDSIALCNLDTAFQRTAARLDEAQFATAPAQLTQAGVSIRSAVEIDLNQDGQDEWVLLVNTPGDDVPVNLWVLLNTTQGVGTTQGVVALPVVPWDLKPYNLPLEDAYTARLSVKTVLSPEGVTIAFIRSGEFLYTIQLDAAGPAVKWALWPKDAVVTYAVYPREDGLELEVARNTYYCKYCTDTYRWEEQGFQSFDAQKEQAIASEAALLERWQPEEAIPLLKTIARDTTYPDQPRNLYLLGLAYELAGDEVHAVQTYWKLWRSYPESAYARLAQAKLELRK